jgi:hypothetical protein
VLVERSALLGNHGAGAFVTGTTAQLTLSGSFVKGTLPGDMVPVSGFGAAAEAGAHLVVEGGLFLGNLGAGLIIGDEGSTLSVTAAVIQRTDPFPDGTFGRGVSIEAAASATITGTSFIENTEAGVLALAPGSNAVVSDCVVERTRVRPSDLGWGVGLSAVEGAHLTATSCVLVDNAMSALYARSPASSIEASRMLITGTTTTPSDGTSGFGAGAADGGLVSIRQSALFGNHSAAIAAIVNGSVVEGSSLLLEGTLPNDVGDYGLGAGAAQTCTVRLTDSVMRENRVAGVLATLGGAAEITRCLVLDTRGGSFRRVDDMGAPTGEPFTGIGDGILISEGAVGRIEDTLATGCPRAGFLFDSSGASIVRSISAGNRFGLVLQGDPRPTVDTSSAFDGNTERAILSDGALPVPNAPPALPPVP